VSKNEEEGKGGPNQEFVLGAALIIAGIPNALVVGLDIDGTDGPTNFAGGFADGKFVAKSESIGIKIYQELTKHNALEVLKRTHNHIYTGSTGTNVYDLKFMLLA
jgi:glycerate-2-kinase